MIYPYNRILLNNRKRWNTDAQNNVDEFPNNCAEKTSKKVYIPYDCIDLKILENAS